MGEHTPLVPSVRGNTKRCDTANFSAASHNIRIGESLFTLFASLTYAYHCRYKERLRCISNAWPCSTYRMNRLSYKVRRPAPVWPCSSVGGAAVIKLEGRGFKSHPVQSFPLSLCGPISICRANAHMVYGLKHQHFTSSHSITTIYAYHCLITLIK